MKPYLLRIAWLAALIACPSVAAKSEAVPITDFIIYGRQHVQIGVGSTVTGTVGSGSTFVGTALIGGTTGIYGDVRSGDDVQLNHYSFVTGTVTNPGTFAKASTATVGAHVTAMPDLPALPAPTIYAAGTTDKSASNSGTMTLAPGSYRNINLGSGATLNLSAGDYFLNSLTASHGLDLNVDVTGGDVQIFVVGAMRLGSVDVHAIGGTAQNFYVETHQVGSNAFLAGGQVNWLGTVFAPYGEIHLGTGSATSTFQGNLWAGTAVTIEHGVTGTTVAASPLQPVPEPASVTLLLLGAAGLGVGHAWRKRSRGLRQAGRERESLPS